MAPPDYSTWLTKEQAAAAIGRSTKAIERATRAGKLEQRFRPQAGSPDVAVYFPDDVAKLAQERHTKGAKEFLVPGPVGPANGNGHHGAAALAIVPAVGGSGEELLRALVTAAVHLMSQTSQTVSETSALFLTLPQAAAVSGLSRACLRRKIAEGTLKAEKDRGWKIRRKDLEQL